MPGVNGVLHYNPLCINKHGTLKIHFRVASHIRCQFPIRAAANNRFYSMLKTRYVLQSKNVFNVLQVLHM